MSQKKKELSIEINNEKDKENLINIIKFARANKLINYEIANKLINYEK